MFRHRRVFVSVCIIAVPVLTNTTVAAPAASGLASLPGLHAAVASAVDGALTEVEKAFASDDYERALSLLADARVAATRKGDRAVLQKISERMKEIRKLKAAYDPLRKHVQALKKNRNDPKANLAIGKFYCAEKGDWDNGLRLLAKGDDAELRMVAQLDLKRPSQPKLQAKLADAWWDCARKERDAAVVQFQLRGRRWYLQARAGLAETASATRERRLRAIRLYADRITIWNQHNGRRADRGTVECTVTLLFEGRPVWSHPVCMPWKADRPASTVLRPPHIRLDQIRVAVTQYYRRGGGLGEIEVFQGNTNISQGCSAITNDYWQQDPAFHPSKVTDGLKNGNEGFWLLNNGKTGWVALDLVNLRNPK